MATMEAFHTDETLDSQATMAFIISWFSLGKVPQECGQSSAVKKGLEPDFWVKS